MASNNNVGSTALVISAWFVAAFLALKYLPSLLRGGGAAVGSVLGPAFGGYGTSYGGLSLSQALNQPKLSPDSAQALAELFNSSKGLQPNGTPLTPAQQSEIMPLYDYGAEDTSIPQSPLGSLLGLPDNLGNVDDSAVSLENEDSSYPLITAPGGFFVDESSAGLLGNPYGSGNEQDAGFDSRDYAISATIPDDGS